MPNSGLSHLETFDDSAARWRFNSFPYIDADGNVVDDVNGNGILDHTEGTGNEIAASTGSTEWYATTPWARCANWLTPLGTWYIPRRVELRRGDMGTCPMGAFRPIRFRAINP